MATIKDAVDDMFGTSQLSAEAALERHFAPGFRQRTNGEWESRDEVLARVVATREVVERLTLTVLEELSDDEHYAERHVVDLVRRDGQRLRQEVYVFARRAPDGRFERIEEATVVLEAEEAGRSA